MHLSNAVFNNLDGFLFCQVLRVLLVENGGAKVLSVSLCSVLDLVQGTQVIQIVQGGRIFLSLVVSTQQNIDLVWSSSQGSSHFPTSKVGLAMRRKFGALVGEFVEIDVLGNVSAQGREGAKKKKCFVRLDQD